MAPKYFLDNLTFLAPCTADWDSMVGGDDVRFCRHCSLKVHNISHLTRSQAQRLINRSDGRLCVRYYRTPDGKNCLSRYRLNDHQFLISTVALAV